MSNLSKTAYIKWQKHERRNNTKTKWLQTPLLLTNAKEGEDLILLKPGIKKVQIQWKMRL